MFKKQKINPVPWLTTERTTFGGQAKVKEEAAAEIRENHTAEELYFHTLFNKNGKIDCGREGDSKEKKQQQRMGKGMEPKK